MLKNGRTDMKNLHANGCSCCNSKGDRRKVKHSAKRREKKEWRKREIN